MRLYLAGKFSRREELIRHAADLKKLGHRVTSRWLTPYEDAHKARGWAFMAKIDLADIRASETTVFFTNVRNPRGGERVEFGYALALKKRLIVVGPLPTIFHALPHVIQFDDWPSALKFIGDA